MITVSYVGIGHAGCPPQVRSLLRSSRKVASFVGPGQAGNAGFNSAVICSTATSAGIPTGEPNGIRHL
jgi:hypothetical protein